MRRLAHLALAASAILLGAACTDDTMTAPAETALAEASPAATGPGAAATYQVTITNLTVGQAFTPPLVAVHRRPVHLFRIGAPASFGVKEIAENGNVGPLQTALSDNRHVLDVVLDVGAPPPLLPGETRSFQISGERGARYLSWVSMLICTNDGFTGLDGIRLPGNIGETGSWETAGYDAGTELNTEDAEDLVPPCGALTGIHDGSIGTGMSDPALAEHGVVHHHPGIQGGGDLTIEVHGWSDPVARITVTRLH